MMKHRILPLLLCLLLLAPLAARAETLYVTSENGGGVNLRSGPSINDKVLTTVPYGSQVEVVETNAGSAWAKVKYKGTEGYMMLRYLSATKPPAKGGGSSGSSAGSKATLSKELRDIYANFIPESYAAAVKPSTPSTYVNLRWSPTMSAPVRTQYWSGSTLEVLSQNGEWSEVRDPSNEMYGFMMSQFLTPLYGTTAASL